MVVGSVCNLDKVVKDILDREKFLGEFEMLLWIIVRFRWILWIYFEIMLMVDGWMF